MPKMIFQFLDVGMGDGTLVQITNPAKPGTYFLVLIDFGEERTQFKIALTDAMKYLGRMVGKNSKDRGFKQNPFIDWLFITHGDKDHYNRLDALIHAEYEGYEKGQLLRFGRVTIGGFEAHYPKGTLKLIQEQNNTVTANVGDMFLPPMFADSWSIPLSDEHSIDITALSANLTKADKNTGSLVLMFTLGDYKVIISGDATHETEAHILASYSAADLESYAIKIGHHGSEGSSSPAWCNAVLPQAIFATADTNWKHPYCNAICNYVAAGSLGPSSFKPTRYACGVGGQQGRYYNNTTDRMICMSMWLWTTTLGKYINEEKKDAEPEILRPSVFCGVQWELEIDTEARPSIGRTDTYQPVKESDVLPYWDCRRERPATTPSPRPAQSRPLRPPAPQFRPAAKGRHTG